jgi:membrane-anchored glycerophosphoryl diester phosphodiesterase (GDPDase)
MAWGEETQVLITNELPKDAIGYSVLFLFSFNIIFSFPLVIYPAHKIIELYLYSGWEKTKKR